MFVVEGLEWRQSSSPHWKGTVVISPAQKISDAAQQVKSIVLYNLVNQQRNTKFSE